MKKVLSWFLVLVFLCSFCGIQAFADDVNEICGSYALSNMDDGSGKAMSAYLPMLAAMGMSATLEIGEDGAATLDLFGEVEEFTFDFEKGVADVDGTELAYTYEDGTLIFGAEGMTMTFIKGELPQPKGEGTFDYYELESYVDEKGEDLSKEAADEAESDQIPNLTIFAAGDAVLDFYGQTMDLEFDFEKSVFVAEEIEIPFTLEEELLSFQDAEGATLRFRLADPGYAGPYSLIALASEEEGDLTEQLELLSSMGLAPTLIIDEEGKGILDLVGVETTILFDFETMTAQAEDDDETVMSFAYEKGIITFEEDGASMTFKRVMNPGISLAELQEIFAS